ncbi:MAG: hypothetical protein ACPG32_01510 [Akkermansiaceae bacterium]
MNKTMTRLWMLAGMSFLAASDVNAQAAVGTIAADQTYAEFGAGSSTSDANLRDHLGKIVVIYYYTPW